MTVSPPCWNGRRWVVTACLPFHREAQARERYEALRGEANG